MSTNQSELDVRRLPLAVEANNMVFDLAKKNQQSLEDVLTGKSNELDLTGFAFLVEAGTPQIRGDHLRLIAAASLALEYWPKRYGGDSRTTFIRKIANTCNVDARQLDSYIVVLGNDKQYREGAEVAAPENLPKLVEKPTGTGRTKLQSPTVVETPALPEGTEPSNALLEYIELAEQGYTNRQIGEIMGCHESTVRRKHAKAGYRRAQRGGEREWN